MNSPLKTYQDTLNLSGHSKLSVTSDLPSLSDDLVTPLLHHYISRDIPLQDIPASKYSFHGTPAISLGSLTAITAAYSLQGHQAKVNKPFWLTGV